MISATQSFCTDFVPVSWVLFFLLIVCCSTVKNASGRPEVRNAKDAIDAYKNITDAINAAEAAANEAKKAADSALNVSPGLDTNNMKYLRWKSLEKI